MITQRDAYLIYLVLIQFRRRFLDVVFLCECVALITMQFCVEFNNSVMNKCRELDFDWLPFRVWGAQLAKSFR